MITFWWSSFDEATFSVKSKKMNYLISTIYEPTYRWQLFLLFKLKHIKAFSSGTLKVLQDPASKLNGRSDCFNISHPTSLTAFKIVHLHLKWWIRNWPVVYILSLRQNTKIDLVMSLHIRLEHTLHFHCWNRHLPWHLLKMRSLTGF